MGRLQGQVAVVTGGGGGFGGAIARRLASEGAAVAVVSRRLEELEAVVAAIEAQGGRILPAAADVTVRAEVEAAVRQVERELGGVTFMVNNAGVPGPFGPIGEVDPDDWWNAQKVHQLGPLYFSSAVLKGMAARGGGRILNINATAGVVKAPNMSAYCVGKAAQLRLTEILDLEARPHGVRAFALHPGMAATGMSAETAQREDARRWAPNMVARLIELQDDAAMKRAPEVCAGVVARIAAGELDPLSGRFLEVTDDFDRLLAEAAG